MKRKVFNYSYIVIYMRMLDMDTAKKPHRSSRRVTHNNNLLADEYCTIDLVLLLPPK